MIPQELLEKYSVAPKEFYNNDNLFYKSFLCATDYICNKIVEGVSTKEEYEEELKYRNIARQEIGDKE